MTSFYPATTTRASTALGITSLMFQIHHDQKAILDLQTQLSTGRRIQAPSQDTSASVRALAAQRQLEHKAQIDKNLSSADTILGATGSTLSHAQDILNEMRGIAVQSSGATLSEAESSAFVAQIQAAISKLADLGNSKFRDQFLFSGSKVLESPLTLAGDTVRFSGNATELKTITDNAATMAANVTADDAFGVKSTKIASMVDLNPSLAADTPLAILHRGDGIRRGAISLSDGSNLVEIDLAKAYNVADVVEAIESTPLGSRTLEVIVSPTGLNVQYADGLGGTLRIDNVGSGAAATDLGINNVGTLAQSPVVGSDLDPIVTPHTRLSQLFGGTGITAGDSFRIVQGNKTYNVSTNNTTTVEQLINKVHRTGAQVEMSLDATGRFFAIRSTESGSTLSIGENGSNLASRLGLRTMDLTTTVSDLNFGQGVQTNDSGDDLVITRTNGSEIRVNLTGVQTVNDVISRINNHVDNFSPALRVTASLATHGNGLRLSAVTGGQPIRVRNVGGSEAAWGLGLVPAGESEKVGVASGANSVIGGADISGIEVGGVFTSLIRMRQAIESGNGEQLSRLTAALDQDIQRMSLARSVVGTRQQSIDRLKDVSAERQLQLKQVESEEIDADLADVISRLSAREAALQASLKLMGQTTRLTLFDYL